MEKVLDTLDAVVDVGGIYEPSQDRFDHHQKGFEEVLGHGFTTKLSSAGLVYKVITIQPVTMVMGRFLTYEQHAINTGFFSLFLFFFSSQELLPALGVFVH